MNDIEKLFKNTQNIKKLTDQIFLAVQHLLFGIWNLIPESKYSKFNRGEYIYKLSLASVMHLVFLQYADSKDLLAMSNIDKIGRLRLSDLLAELRSNKLSKSNINIRGLTNSK